MDKAALKKRVWDLIDSETDRIIRLGERIWENPELGYKEAFGTKAVTEFLETLGLDVKTEIAVTGCAADIHGAGEGPTIAILGELDAIVCPDHPEADGKTGAVHACGHHIQVAAMAGAALGLAASGVMTELSGTVRVMAVPAEEFVELAFRSQLKEDGKISYFGGKQELVANGGLDGVDVAMMIHSLDLAEGKKVLIGPNGNGFIGKEVRFVGKEAHAGGAPEDGVNALNAAMLAISGIHAQRETFKDGDRVRVHPILTRAGDIVNVVPADVRMESYVRARTVEAMLEANRKVDRALKGGAMAVGAGVEITDTPGYLPLLDEPTLSSLYRENAVAVAGDAVIVDGGDFTGSFDFGDLSHLMPTLHPFAGGVKGALHTRKFEMVDADAAMILPAKLMAATVIDLLAEDARAGKRLCETFVPKMTRRHYLDLLESLGRTTSVPAWPVGEDRE